MRLGKRSNDSLDKGQKFFYNAECNLIIIVIGSLAHCRIRIRGKFGANPSQPSLP